MKTPKTTKATKPKPSLTLTRSSVQQRARRIKLADALMAGWIVATDHPYYPEVEYFDDEARARAHAAEQIAFYHTETGIHDESRVTVARVEQMWAIRTDY